MTRLYYAGIGSRETPEPILNEMTTMARALTYYGLILRSGGADGADTAFELGAREGLKQIFLPWPAFNRNPSPLVHLTEEAFAMARRFHPAFDRLSQGAQKLMARNSYQVLGPELNEPSLFVLCWTEGGKGKGGTGQAIRIAHEYGIPVFDRGGMALRDIEDQVGKLLFAQGIRPEVA